MSYLKHLYISLPKSWWYDLQFLRYREKHTEIGNFRSFFALLPLKKPQNQNFEKWKNLLEILFYTCAPKISIIWCVVPEIRSETGRIFCHSGPFFALLPPPPPPCPLWTQKTKILEKWKKCLNILSFYTNMCTINDNHMMYSSWDMKCDRIFLSFWTVFCLFTPPNKQKIKILKKWKKSLEILSFYTCVP